MKELKKWARKDIDAVTQKDLLKSGIMSQIFGASIVVSPIVLHEIGTVLIWDKGWLDEVEGRIDKGCLGIWKKKLFKKKKII